MNDKVKILSRVGVDADFDSNLVCDLNIKNKVLEIIKSKGFCLNDFDESQLKIISIAIEQQINVRYFNALINPLIGAFFMKSALDDIIFENIDPLSYLYSGVTLDEYCVLRGSLLHPLS